MKTAREQVKEFARYHGLKIAPKPGNEPLIGKGDWFQVFDSWDEARGYFRAAYEAHIDRGIPYPWNDK